MRQIEANFTIRPVSSGVTTSKVTPKNGGKMVFGEDQVETEIDYEALEND